MSVAPLDPLNGIEVESLSKRYHVSKDSGSRLGSFLFNRWNTRRDQTVVHALNDVSFSVARGEMVGIVGTNGSGKSTLLRTICGITQSDSGTVRRLPRVSALLDLFAGFHPTLTGYENLFLNASILGISRRELREKLPEIVKYSGIEPAYLDSPVRFYSAGMKARLGFSLAVQFDPDIVLVDEVLAVGDLEFQEKSAIRILEFREQGKAMILVSHSTGTIQQLCSQAIWLDKGHVRMSGTATQVVTAYTQFLQERSLSSLGREEGLVSNEALPGVDHLGAVTLLDSSNQLVSVFATGGPMRVAIETKSNLTDERFDYQIIIRHSTGSIVVDIMMSEYLAPNAMPDGDSFQFHIDALPLTGGNYELQVAALATASPAHTVDRSPWVAFEIPVSHYNYDVYPADIPVKLSIE